MIWCKRNDWRYDHRLAKYRQDSRFAFARKLKLGFQFPPVKIPTVEADPLRAERNIFKADRVELFREWPTGTFK